MVVLATAAAGLGARTLDEWRSALPALSNPNDEVAGSDPTPELFVVPPGASAATVAVALERAGLIRSGRAFRTQAEARGLDGRLGAGEYELRQTMTVSEILDVLAASRTRQGGLTTIPEGWRAEEVATYLDARGIVDRESFLRVVAGDGTDVRFPPGATSFEGYLFPDSYALPPHASADDILRLMVGQFDSKVDASLRARAAENGLSPHGMVTLASIIEREAMVSDERRQIAAVFHNRLDLGMPLQADPTIQYALVPFGQMGPDLDYWRRDLTALNLRTPSPYNTYQTTGLPPGPICSPGLASLQAAADPTHDPWLYFVAMGDGTHLFARTLDEHLRNVARAEAN
ncbi:MAG: aminodeoxychorismate lyase [Chloroflexi bacterium]|nr:aminodeoxychorismate lyase [Chloroflexota bacterium]